MADDPEIFIPDGPFTVETDVFCQHFGGCASCPGIATAAEVGYEAAAETRVLCVCGCHRVQ